MLPLSARRAGTIPRPGSISFGILLLLLLCGLLSLSGGGGPTLYLARGAPGASESNRPVIKEGDWSVGELPLRRGRVALGSTTPSIRRRRVADESAAEESEGLPKEDRLNISSLGETALALTENDASVPAVGEGELQVLYPFLIYHIFTI